MAVEPTPAAATIAAVVGGLCWGVQGWLDGPAWLALPGAVAAALAIRREPWDLGRGLLLGVVWQGVALLWLPAAWAGFGGPGWVPPVVVLWQALPVALAQGGAALAARRGIPLPLALALAWMAAEGIAGVWDPLPWTPSVLLASTPWALLPAAWLGRAALSGLLLGLGAMTVQRPRLAGAALMGILALGLGWSAWPGASPTVRVGLVQPDVGALEGRRPSSAPDRAERTLALIAAARADGAEIVLTPEGAWPHDLGTADGQRRRDLATALLGTGPVLLGASVGHPVPTNSLVAVQDGVATDQVDKQWLVPVAERRLGSIGRDRYQPGGTGRTLTLDGVRLSAWICYEDVFPTAAATAGDGQLGVAATNDAWLPGRGAEQHLAAARLLAVTTRRWVARPALSGPSAVIDPAGRVHWRTAWTDGDERSSPGQHAVLDVPLRTVVWWGGRLDPITPWMAAVLLAVLAGRRRPA